MRRQASPGPASSGATSYHVKRATTGGGPYTQSRRPSRPPTTDPRSPTARPTTTWSRPPIRRMRARIRAQAMAMPAAGPVAGRLCLRPSCVRQSDLEWPKSGRSLPRCRQIRHGVHVPGRSAGLRRSFRCGVGGRTGNLGHQHRPSSAERRLLAWINGVAVGGTAYQTAVVNYVNLLSAANIAAIIDLQWAAPGTTLSNQLTPMPDSDHAPAFWTSVANNVQFKSFGDLRLVQRAVSPTAIRIRPRPGLVSKTAAAALASPIRRRACSLS